MPDSQSAVTSDLLRSSRTVHLEVVCYKRRARLVDQEGTTAVKHAANVSADKLHRTGVRVSVNPNPGELGSTVHERSISDYARQMTAGQRQPGQVSPLHGHRMVQRAK